MHLAALDRPGLGGGEPRHAVPSLEEQTSALLPILQRSRARVILVGHSLGAPIAMHMHGRGDVAWTHQRPVAREWGHGPRGLKGLGGTTGYVDGVGLVALIKRR